jgi:hypothetical protein
VESIDLLAAVDLERDMHAVARSRFLPSKGGTMKTFSPVAVP